MKSKLLLVSIDKTSELGPNPRSPAYINLDLELDLRIARAQRKGYLTSRLASCKKQIQPAQSQMQPWQSRETRKVRETRKSSLQLLPKLNQYEFPIEQIPEKQTVGSSNRPHLKISPLKTVHDFKSRKGQFREELHDDIDNILIKMLAGDDLVHKKIEEDLERQLTEEDSVRNWASKRRSVNPRLEGISCVVRKLQATGLRSRIRQSLNGKGSANNRCQDSMGRWVSPSKKRQGQLKGWEAPHVDDFNGF